MLLVVISGLFGGISAALLIYVLLTKHRRRYGQRWMENQGWIDNFELERVLSGQSSSSWMRGLKRGQQAGKQNDLGSLQILQPIREKYLIAKGRQQSVEAHLPELSETLSMGLRAGLSFDRAFALYHERFSDDLACLCEQAQKRWETGFMTREESLNLLAEESESELMARLVANINRSMRLGGSLTRALEIFSSEARSCHKAKMEEKISKVSVKMMIPTALCILPSMLILVLGPVMLRMLMQ